MGALTPSEPRQPFYGHDLQWALPLEAAARRRHGRALSVELGRGRLTYRHSGLEIPGRVDPVPVGVHFHADPPYDTYGLPPEQYPRVYADQCADSPHRMPDDSLCLYYPADPPERRWLPEHGLAALLDVVNDHLFYELHWRATGGRHGGQWLGDEAPHGWAA
jgi:hypothetical protein